MILRSLGAAVVGGFVSVSVTAALAPPLSGLATLELAYDATLDARFEEAASVLARCDGAPREACDVVDLARRQWQILLDPDDLSQDAAALAAVDRALAGTRRWTEREPTRAEAWFYHGAALGVRVQLRVLRGQTLAAARDGRAIKRTLERSLELDPEFADAELALGLYEYYAGTAPLVLRMLGRLLLLPGGDRARGLERLERAALHGTLVASEADYQRHFLYLWYERRFDAGLDVLERLATQYPNNPLFLLQWADGLEEYRRRTEDSRDAYERVARRLEATPGRQLPSALRTRAILGLAARLDSLAETDRAVQWLERTTTRPDGDGPWHARSWLALGRAYRRLGDTTRAEAAFRRVAALGDGPGLGTLGREARRELGVRGNAAQAAAYRIALQGWRAAEAQRFDEAAALLGRALADQPHDVFARARLGHVMVRLGRPDEAHEAFERVLADPQTPPALVAGTALASALLFEAQGHEASARARFEHARDAFGASTLTKRQAIGGLARLAEKPRAS